ncbi:hypothetical protein HKX48_001979, partial [Thoreauomyces humboldtii]
MSIFATCADSIFDPFSNVILYLGHRASGKGAGEKYPSGRARLESVGNCVYGFLMITVSVIVIVESIRVLLTPPEDETFKLNIPSVVSVGVALGVKFLLFLYCYSYRSNSQVRMLWEDHRNDLFVNGFGILTSVGGGLLRWWVDPMGAIVLSIFIITLWTRTVYGQFQLLAGISAPADFVRLVTYKAMLFDPAILQIDTCRAYHSGPKVIVEVDIVLPPDMPVREAHDIGEALQTAIENHRDVERAYVHIDFETSHKP